MTDPFHSGEIQIQEQVGVRDAALRLSRMVVNYIPRGAAQFLNTQEVCALGWTAPNKELWAGILTGALGFAHTSDNGALLHLDLSKLHHTQHEALVSGALKIGNQTGMLFIDLSDRRRLRVNGTIDRLFETQLTIKVEEVFPNCPKYIQRRLARRLDSTNALSSLSEGTSLTNDIINWVTIADTFFVASAHPDGRTDVSHRGGKPGFVRVQEGKLYIPDYQGNNMFGTLGGNPPEN
ncbi:MAG: hypothetical protein Q9M45_10930 [Robiginitomaculum sp.]|nr:hypothetical protein [Robiginitomaculum sp.]